MKNPSNAPRATWTPNPRRAAKASPYLPTAIASQALSLRESRERDGKGVGNPGGGGGTARPGRGAGSAVRYAPRPMAPPDASPPFAAVISPVREVTLHGSADLAPWRDVLRAEGLAPAESEGRARILVSAIASSFKGKRFREAVLSVGVASPDGAPAGFLSQAFNSSRLFAFIERRVFRTPYVHAHVALDEAPATGFEVRVGSVRVLRLALGLPADARPREPLRTAGDLFEGRIHLPSRPGAARTRGRWFHARLEGEARFYAFDPALDACEIGPVPAHPTLARLIDSGFRGETWMIRDAGKHGRSKTFRSAAGA